MPAAIFGDRFAAHREPAWHGLGTVFNEPKNMVEAVRDADMEYEIQEYPYHIVTPAGQFDVPNKKALVREATKDDPQSRLFGVVGNKYSVIQNTELAEILNPLTERWPVETVGALDLGKEVFFALDAGSMKVGGEEINNYFLVHDSKGGGETLSVNFTPVRVVCQNTLVTGLAAATTSIRMRHYETLHEDMGFYVKLFGDMQRQADKVQEKFDILANTKIGSEELDMIISSAYPVPARPQKSEIIGNMDAKTLGKQATNRVLERFLKAHNSYEEGLEKVKVVHNEIKTRYENFPQKDVAGTAWAAWNVVVEVEDYRKGGNKQYGALFGARAKNKQNAFATAVSIAAA